MRRDQLIIQLFEQENLRFSELSKDASGSRPKKGCEAEWKHCGERLDILDQMLEEIPMDHFKNNKETGLVRQVFVGTIEERSELFLDCKDTTHKYYYIKMIIKGFGDEQFYKDERLLRLSYEIWRDWFFNVRYEKEKEERIKKNLPTYVQVTVIDGEIKKLKWYMV